MQDSKGFCRITENVIIGEKDKKAMKLKARLLETNPSGLL